MQDNLVLSDPFSEKRDQFRLETLQAWPEFLETGLHAIAEEVNA